VLPNAHLSDSVPDIIGKNVAGASGVKKKSLD